MMMKGMTLMRGLVENVGEVDERVLDNVVPLGLDETELGSG